MSDSQLSLCALTQLSWTVTGEPTVRGQEKFRRRLKYSNKFPIYSEIDKSYNGVIRFQTENVTALWM